MAGPRVSDHDVEWLESDDPDTLDYNVDAGRAEGFSRAVRAYWPGVDPARLVPDYAGVRPKLVPAGAPAGDFVIEHRPLRRDGGLVNLLGVESPGLTAALALGEAVADLCLSR